jgi:SAM-dependent methyltransferase
VSNSAPEDTYGTQKRMAFIGSAVAAQIPRSVLDVGCGVGNVSLAVAERFPGISVTGLDSDLTSIEYARRRSGARNVQFLHDSELGADAKFDLIIASEVLEHVYEPEQFLISLQGRLNAGGYMIVTVPNGYGPFEIMSLIEGTLRLTGIHGLLRALRRVMRGGRQAAIATPDTMAVSPHVNFFSHQRLEGLLARAGLTVCSFQPRTFLCGFLLDNLIRSERLVTWNASVADRLPVWLSSDWMFLLKGGSPDMSVAPWKNGFWGRLHRYVNQRCLGRARKT